MSGFYEIKNNEGPQIHIFLQSLTFGELVPHNIPAQVSGFYHNTGNSIHHIFALFPLSEMGFLYQDKDDWQIVRMHRPFLIENILLDSRCLLVSSEMQLQKI